MVKRKIRKLALIPFVLGIFLIVLFCIYQYQTSPVDKTSNADIEVIIPSGTSTVEIATLLHDKGLIRSPNFFKLYLKLNRSNTLKASTYLLKKNMSLEEIVAILTDGTYNANALTITFPEGRGITYYGELLEENTNIKKEDFLAKMQDETYLNSLIEKYWFLTDAILDDNIYYGLEGYLAPDTYQFSSKEVSIEEVITTLLDHEEKRLESLRSSVSPENIHEILTLASMTELEGVTKEDRRLIISVFRNRLEKGMNLGSDVTTYYAFQEEMTKDLTSAMFNTYNPYNTRSIEMAGKIPVGPICNPSLESIEATVDPLPTEALYFVADKNGVVYYTKTQEEHEQKVIEIKEKGDWIW